MLYKFKSKAAGDLIMLEANGRHVLEIIGKDAGAQGIIQTAEMPGAISALELAIADEETPVDNDTRLESAHRESGVSLRQRAVPFIDMLRRCLAENVDVTWGT